MILTLISVLLLAFLLMASLVGVLIAIEESSDVGSKVTLIAIFVILLIVIFDLLFKSGML